MPRLSACFPLLLLLGCVSVQPIRSDPAPPLREDEGILVLHIESEVEIERLAFAGGAALVRNLPPGRHLLLFAVTAGEYSWHEIVLPTNNAWGGVRFRFKRGDTQRFRVERGRISYPGQFVLHGEVEKEWVALGGRMAINRSALALTELLDRYPETLRRYPPIYGGPERDDYLDFFAEQILAPGASAAP